MCGGGGGDGEGKEGGKVGEKRKGGRMVGWDVTTKMGKCAWVSRRGGSEGAWGN